MTAPPPPARLLPANSNNLEIAADLLRAGGLVAFPTETLYGLGADARNETAVMNVFQAKQRAKDKPLIVLLQDIQEAAQYGELNEHAYRLAEAFWPGALTLIVRQRDSSPLAPGLNPQSGTVALRVPGNAIAMRLLRAFSGPLTAPSANITGAAPAKTAGDVMQGLGHAIDAVLDGGACPGNESTLLDLSGGAPRLLRDGAISRGRIESVLGPLDI